MPIFGPNEPKPGAARSLTTVSRKRHVRELYNPDQIGAVLRRERARSDRQHCGFSIVLFRLDITPFHERPLIRLATVLLKLIRETDELGRYDQHTLCAVLPDTDAVGASILIARVRRATHGKGYEPTCTIYTYPDPQDKSGPGGMRDRPANQTAQRDSDDARLTNGTSERRHDVGLTRDGGVEVEVGSLFDSLPGVAVLDEPEPAPEPVTLTQVEVFPAHSMSELFAEPLPAWKRALDIAVAGVAILASSPLLIAAAIGIRLSSPGPIVFRQNRTGLGGRPFTIYKFRTMCIDAEAKQAALKALSEQDGPAFKLKNDPRIFPLGRFLRKTSIDELPQLFNVLKGDMTLVGPRPLPVHEADAVLQWQQRRHDVTPGLTCTWQVEGRSRVKFEEWMRMDMRYARRRNLVHDLALVAKTVPAVLLRRGAN
jgi:lipopolysaccharide/colanic/teichoic acid biosynthesis glycosyltransferase